VVIDTLRFDRLGSYGHEQETSPAIDALAADGIRFERAYATAPWTKASVASILTGLYPRGHGSVGYRDKLPEDVETLAELLRDRGFATAGVVSNLFLADALGFSQGFDHWLQSEARGHDHLSTDGVTAQALQLLESFAEAGNPFLLFVHYMDPHFDYKRHPEYGFAQAKAGRLDGSQSNDQLVRMRASLDAAELQLLRDLYDEEVRATDAGLERLLDGLTLLDLESETLVAITSDHGEEFMERGWLGHTRSLNEELIRVPLIVRDPRSPRRGAVVSGPVSLASLTPTLLEALGFEIEDERFQAPSLAAELRGERDGPGAPVLSEVDVSGWEPDMETRRQALIDGRHKLIVNELANTVELFDLELDPMERRNLAAEDRALTTSMARQLAEALETTRREPVASTTWEPSREELDMLRELGYEAP